VKFQGTVLDKENAFRKWDKLTILVFLVVSGHNSFKRVLRFCWGAIVCVRSAGTMKARKHCGRNLLLWPRCGYEKRQFSINIETLTDRIMGRWAWLVILETTQSQAPPGRPRPAVPHYYGQTSVRFNNGLPRSL
jgi:hypothetical protein